MRYYQNERLRALLQHAEGIPFWHTIFTAAEIDLSTFSLGDISNLPVTTKSSFRNTQLDFIDHRYEPISYTDSTSGSTGEPFTYLHDAGYVLRMFAICERLFRTAGGGVRYPVVSMRTKPRHDFAFYKSEHFFVRGYNTLSLRLAAFFERAASYKHGFIIYSFPSILSELAKLVDAEKRLIPLRAVISTAEDLRPEERAKIETMLHVKVFSCYGTRELGGLTFECSRGRLHINEESVYLEITDESGTPLAAGMKGRVVATPFDHRVMPFIRYFTGDIGVIDTSACPCGRTLATISIQGRESHLIDLGNDRFVPLLEIASIFDIYADAISQYQIRHTAERTFVIRVVPGLLFEEKKVQLYNLLISVLDPAISLTYEHVDHIPAASSGKANYFVRLFD